MTNPRTRTLSLLVALAALGGGYEPSFGPAVYREPDPPRPRPPIPPQRPREEVAYRPAPPKPPSGPPPTDRREERRQRTTESKAARNRPRRGQR